MNNIEEVKKILKDNDKLKTALMYLYQWDRAKCDEFFATLAQQICQLEPKPDYLTITPARTKILLDFFEWCELPDLTRQEIEDIRKMSMELKELHNE